MLDDLLLVVAAELLVALAADAEELDRLAVGDQRIGLLARKSHDRRVERPAQAALGGADEQQVHLVIAGAAQQRGRGVEPGDRGGDIAEHLVHALGIGPRRLRRDLRAPQLRGRDHLHRLGDLLRRLGGGDAHAHVFERGHVSPDLAARSSAPLSPCGEGWGEGGPARTFPQPSPASGRGDRPKSRCAVLNMITQTSWRSRRSPSSACRRWHRRDRVSRGWR